LLTAITAAFVGVDGDYLAGFVGFYGFGEV